MARFSFVFLLLALTLLVVENTQGCSWPGHCQGALCKNYNDCSDNLICGLCGARGGGSWQCCQPPQGGKRRRRDLMAKDGGV